MDYNHQRMFGRLKLTASVRIAALSLVCAMALVSCGRPAVQPSERAALENSLSISLEAARKDSSPSFTHNAEADVMRLLELDRNERDYGKTMEHVGSLVEILEKNGRQEEAKRLLEAVKKFHEWNFERENGKKETGDQHYDLAETHLRKAVDAGEHLDRRLFSAYSPNLMEDYAALAEVLQKQNKTGEAEQIYRKMLSATLRGEGKTSDAAARAQLKLVQFYRDTNQSHKAMSNLNLLLKKFPHNIEARQHRAELHSAQGKHENAMKDVDEILKVQPTNEWAKHKKEELTSHFPRNR